MRPLAGDIIIQWFVVGLLLALLAFSLTGPGTWFGGLSVLLVVALPLILLAGAFILAWMRMRRRPIRADAAAAF